MAIDDDDGSGAKWGTLEVTLGMGEGSWGAGADGGVDVGHGSDAGGCVFGLLLTGTPACHGLDTAISDSAV